MMEFNLTYQDSQGEESERWNTSEGTAGTGLPVLIRVRLVLRDELNREHVFSTTIHPELAERKVGGMRNALTVRAQGISEDESAGFEMPVVRMDLKKRERGTALVLTLLIIITLAGLTLGFSGESGVELTLAGYMKDSTRAYQLARSGVDIALELLARDEDFEMDTFNEDWRQFGSIPLAEGIVEEGVSFSGGMVDENSKININLLRNSQGEIDEKREAQMRRLFRAMGVKEERLNPVLDWLDADDIERQDGAEGYFYQNLEEPYECANGPFLTVGPDLSGPGHEGARAFRREEE